MSKIVLTDVRIAELLKMEKDITKAPKRGTQKGKHFEWDFELESADGTKFTIFVRDNSMIENGFSCGLCWVSPSGEHVALLRCNGGYHPHPNRIEGNHLPIQAHIHRATERYMKRGNPCGFAETTDIYDDIDGALKHLVEVCNVSGIDGLPGRNPIASPQLSLLQWKN